MIHVLAALLVMSTLAHAQPGATPMPEPRAPSYRSRTVAADGLAISLWLLAIRTTGEEPGGDTFALITLSATAYLFGAPGVHLVRSRSDRALGSFAMRLGFPLVGMLAGGGLASSERRCHLDVCSTVDNKTTTAGIGLLVGVAAAMVLDSAFLAGAGPMKPARWQPSLAPTRGGLALGLGGSF